MAAKTTVVNVRLDETTLERVENYRTKLEEEFKIEISRSAAIKRLLSEALDEVEKG